MSLWLAEPRAAALSAQTRWLSGARLASVAAMLALYVVLGFLYDHVVAPHYSFGAFQVSPRDDGWIEVATVILAGLVLPTETRRMTHLFAWLSTVFLLVPAAVLSAHQGSDRQAMFLMFGSVWLVMFLCRMMADSNFLFGIDSTPATAKVDAIKMLSVTAAVLFFLAIHVEGRVSFSLADVYDYRQDFNDSLYFPLNYLLPFAAGPLAGLITAAALYKRQYWVLALVMAMGLLFFGFSSHKAMLFYPPFAAIIFAAISYERGHIYLIATFFVLSILTIFSAGTPFQDILGSSFANRLVFIPAQIHYYFFREFGAIGPQFWAESRLGLGLHHSDLPIPSVNYIGLMMTGDSQIGANTGWIANGYMNGHLVGILIYALILSATLHLIDRLGARYGYAFIGAAFSIPIFNFVNSIDLFAGFLTGGLLLLFVIFFMSVRPIAAGTATEPA